MPSLFTLVTTLALSGLVLFTAPARANAQIYFNRNAWQAVTVLRVDRDFNHLPDAQQIPLTSPYLEQGVSFSATNNYLYSWGPAGCCSGRDAFGTGGSWLIGPWNNGSFEVKFPPNTTSIGFDLAAYNGYPPAFAASIRMKSGQHVETDLVPDKGGHLFWGYTSYTDPIASITITSRNGNNVVLDNVSTGTFIGP